MLAELASAFRNTRLRVVCIGLAAVVAPWACASADKASPIWLNDGGNQSADGSAVATDEGGGSISADATSSGSSGGGGSSGSGGGSGGSSSGTTANDATVPATDSSTSSSDAGGIVALDRSIGAAQFAPGELDPASHGGTITFQTIGGAGSFASMRDPALGMCDAKNVAGCCLATNTIASNALTPWDEDLIMTLRGPMIIKQFVTYQPDPAATGQWSLVSSWDSRTPQAPKGMAFNGNGTQTKGFNGTIGTECLVDVSTDKVYPCGPGGAVPYCPPAGGGGHKYYGWAGSKLFVVLTWMPHADSGKIASPCSTTTTGGWWDAPWVGLSLGELVRAGAFSPCNCYSKPGGNAASANGCGQFNVFEVVNDNNSFRNLDVFSTDLVDYSGYVGEGPCGTKCNATAAGPAADLIDKATGTTEALMGAISNPTKGPRAALRRQAAGYRYMLMLLDVASRTVQLALVHPQNVPPSIAGLLPNLPPQLPQATVDSVAALRLPK